MTFEQHLNLIAYGRLEHASVEAVAERIAAIDAAIPDDIRADLTRLLSGQRPADIVARLRAALDPARQAQEARRISELPPGAIPSPAQVAEAAEYLLLGATTPLAASPAARTRLVALDRIY